MRHLAGMGVAVIATPISQNTKLGPVSQTTTTLQSCGPCPFKDNGCYAQQGPLGWMVKRMGDHVQDAGLDILDIARDEATAIDGLNTRLPLRLHVAGDCSTDDAAQIVSEAAGRYTKRNRSQSWTYTHAWRTVDRASWGSVSVLASCETTDDTTQAAKRGYAPAVVVSEYPNGRKAWNLDNGMTAIPCPQMTTKNVTCASCRLCWDDAKLRERNAVIAFAAHGVQIKKIKVTLDVLNG